MLYPLSYAPKTCPLSPQRALEDATHKRKCGVVVPQLTSGSHINLTPRETSLLASSLKLRPASVGELDVVFAILEELRSWLGAQGLAEQWPSAIPKELLMSRIQCGYVNLALMDDEGPPVGTITVLPEDVEVWGHRQSDALYIHGLAVPRAFAGNRVGEAMIDLAGDMARTSGRRFLRLDCWQANQDLCDYYRRLGFREVGVKRWPRSSFTTQKFERDAEYRATNPD